MPSLLHGILLLALAASEGAPAPPAQDDEVRIEALMAAEEAHEVQAAAEQQQALALEAEAEQEQVATTFPPPRGTQIALADLERMKGYAVVVRTRAGGTRFGIVQDVLRGDLALHVRMRSGYAQFRVPLRQIESVEAD